MTKTTRTPNPPAGGTWHWDAAQQRYVNAGAKPDAKPASDGKTIPFRQHKPADTKED